MATPVILPVQGNTVETCKIVEWYVNIGSTVKSGDLICAVETDKAVFEIESPAEGTVLDIFFKVEDNVPVLTNLAVIGNPGEDVEALRPKPEEKQETSRELAGTAITGESEINVPGRFSSDSKPVAERLLDGSVPVSPRAQKLAAARGVPIGQLQGSGPLGRIIERDVQAYLQEHPPLTPAARDKALNGYMAPPSGTGLGGRIRRTDMIALPEKYEQPDADFTEIPVKGIRKLIAERMKASLQATAQLTLHTSADASAFVAFRAKLKADAALSKIYNITINDLMLFVTANVLSRHPSLNAHFAEDKIRQYHVVNLGFAVDTPRGLMVPVINHIQQSTLGEISVTARQLTETCIKGNISPDSLQGGTFTLTNLGAFGIEAFTPVINLPQVAILGINTIQPKPIQEADEIIWRPHIGLSLTIDHQVVDGADGARFLKDLIMAIAEFDSTQTMMEELRAESK